MKCCVSYFLYMLNTTFYIKNFIKVKVNKVPVVLFNKKYPNPFLSLSTVFTNTQTNYNKLIFCVGGQFMEGKNITILRIIS